jgi:hypothetical protein
MVTEVLSCLQRSAKIRCRQLLGGLGWHPDHDIDAVLGEMPLGTLPHASRQDHVSAKLAQPLRKQSWFVWRCLVQGLADDPSPV